MSYMRADTNGAGAEPTPSCFCLLRVAIRSAFVIGWSLLELICTNSSAMWGAQAASSWAVTPVSSACHETMTSCSASFFGLYGTVLQGFSQLFTLDPAVVGGWSSILTS